MFGTYILGWSFTVIPVKPVYPLPDMIRLYHPSLGQSLTISREEREREGV